MKILISDIGGHNCRLRIVDENNATVKQANYPTKEIKSFYDLLV
jgi:glucokinase